VDVDVDVDVDAGEDDEDEACLSACCTGKAALPFPTALALVDNAILDMIYLKMYELDVKNRNNSGNQGRNRSTQLDRFLGIIRLP
jgi:hypothetical protein